MKDNWYKGKRIDGQGWVYGYLIGLDVIVGELVDFNDEYFNTEYWYKVIPETVGQYVFSSRNGEIYYTGDTFVVVCDCDEEYGCSHPEIECELVWNERYSQYGFMKNDGTFVLLDEYSEENVFKTGNKWNMKETL